MNELKYYEIRISKLILPELYLNLQIVLQKNCDDYYKDMINEF